MNNKTERAQLRIGLNNTLDMLSNLRAETYNFALNIYSKWRFGNIAQDVFDMKRRRIEKTLLIFIIICIK